MHRNGFKKNNFEIAHIRDILEVEHLIGLAEYLKEPDLDPIEKATVEKMLKDTENRIIFGDFEER